MKRVLGILVPLTMLSMALAGCGDNGGGGSPGPTTSAPLKAGKGAIAGLLIDDAYRPLQLSDTAQGPYAAKGVILLQPEGLTSQTTADGEFTFINLEPGSYTLRAEVSGHDAAPFVVDVREGQYAEVNMIARRISSEGSRIITTEYNVFIPCSADYLANGGVLDCTFDQSGDSFRPGFESNYTGQANVTYLVTEMKANNPGRYEVQVRCEFDDRYDYFAVSQFEGDYVKIVMPFNKTSETSAELSYGPNLPWNNDCTMNTILFTDSAGREEQQQAGVGLCCGVGFQAGIKAKFVQSLFIGEPDVSIASYSVLA